MLVLTRKSEQKIIIGNRKRVVITILKVQGGMVSIGIEADKETPIYREELLQEIEQENVGGAVQGSSVDVKGLAQKLKIKPRSRRSKKATSSALSTASSPTSPEEKEKSES